MFGKRKPRQMPIQGINGMIPQPQPQAQGFMQGQKRYAQAAPAQPSKFSTDRIAAALGSLASNDGGAGIRNYDANMQAQMQQQQMIQQLSQGMSPQMAAAVQANPQAVAELLAKRNLGVHQITAGNSVYDPQTGQYNMAPKTFQNGSQIARMNPDGSINSTDLGMNADNRVDVRGQDIDQQTAQMQDATKRYSIDIDNENTDFSNQTGRINALTGRDRLNFERESAASGPSLTDTKGFEAADKAFGQEYNEWTSGKRADAQKNLEQLDSVIEMLGSGGNYTGGFVGQVPDRIAAVNPLDPAGPARIAARERVEEVVQRNLREVLGAQFTEKEGERLIKRAYNPMLSEEENIYRLTNLANQVRKSIQNRDAKAAYFAQNGTLVGFEAAPADPLGIR